jgi:hypothetical protein
MKDSILELRQNNFMKVNFDLIKTRENHNLNLRKSKFDEMINTKRCIKKKETTIPSQLEINQVELAVDDILKQYKVIVMVKCF